MDKAPYFTIVIPTYNPGDFLPRLLSSIAQNECTDLIEVIVSDDCSTEKFESCFQNFPMLNIKKIVNEKHVGFPCTGRQNGANAANGKWICFSDQDDFFLDNAFDNIKKFIEETNATNYIVSDFILMENEDEGHIENAYKGWTHGKFYENSFWKQKNIHYDNVDYCEDIDLTIRVNCILLENNIEPIKYPDPLYVWCRREDSLSNIDYFIQSMTDYVYISMGIPLEYMKVHMDNIELFQKYNTVFITAFYHVYFYSQCAMNHHRTEALTDAIRESSKYLREYTELTGITNQQIIELTKNEFLEVYEEVRHDDFLQVKFIEQITFEQMVGLCS